VSVAPARRWLIPSAVVAIGLLATGGIAWLEHRGAVDATRERARHDAAELATRIELAFAVPAQEVFALATWLAMTPELDHRRFSAFAGPTPARQPTIYALEWAPLVEASGRATLEERARAEGLDGFEIREGFGGTFRRAADRSRYLPILYTEPANPAVGFDLLSRPDRLPALMQRTIVTGRIDLVEGNHPIPAVAVYEPVVHAGDPARALAGYAVVVFELEPLVARSLQGMSAGAALELRDLDADPGSAALWGAPLSGEVAAQPVDVLGRRWEVRRPVPATALSRGVATTLLLGPIATLGALLLWLAAANLRRLRRRDGRIDQLGQYQLLELIGKGGMGEVYRARHALLRRPTAIKLLRAAEVEEVARFEREVQLTAELTHPNVVAVYDFGRGEGGAFYYAMEFLDGVTVGDLVEHGGAQPLARTVHVMRQLVGAIIDAHTHGLIHRDLKPANVMLIRRAGDRDFVKVLDFGLAKQVEVGALAAGSSPGSPTGDAPVTAPGLVIGTIGFSSPEALRGHDTDVAADVYSLGAIWYTMLAGNTPFIGQQRAMSFQQITGDPPPPSKRVGGVPAELDELILRMMARGAADRPTLPDVAQILESLGRAWTPGDADLWWRTAGLKVRDAVRRQRAEALEAAIPATRKLTITRRAEPR
jgi:serine/threonine-protein kinase